MQAADVDTLLRSLSVKGKNKKILDNYWIDGGFLT